MAEKRRWEPFRKTEGNNDQEPSNAAAEDEVETEHVSSSKKLKFQNPTDEGPSDDIQRRVQIIVQGINNGAEDERTSRAFASESSTDETSNSPVNSVERNDPRANTVESQNFVDEPMEVEASRYDVASLKFRGCTSFDHYPFELHSDEDDEEESWLESHIACRPEDSKLERLALVVWYHRVIEEYPLSMLDHDEAEEDLIDELREYYENELEVALTLYTEDVFDGLEERFRTPAIKLLLRDLGELALGTKAELKAQETLEKFYHELLETYEYNDEDAFNAAGSSRLLDELQRRKTVLRLSDSARCQKRIEDLDAPFARRTWRR